MAAYAYKEVCHRADFTAMEEQFQEKYGREIDGDANYDGDYWTVAADLLDAKDTRIADLEARLATAEGEVVRLNQWADGMTDIALKERATGEAYQRELRDKIADLEAKVEKAPCSDFCRDAKEKHHIPYTEHHHACWKVEALGLEGQDYMRRTEAK